MAKLSTNSSLMENLDEGSCHFFEILMKFIFSFFHDNYLQKKLVDHSDIYRLFCKKCSRSTTISRQSVCTINPKYKCNVISKTCSILFSIMLYRFAWLLLDKMHLILDGLTILFCRQDRQY